MLQKRLALAVPFRRGRRGGRGGFWRYRRVVELGVRAQCERQDNLDSSCDGIEEEDGLVRHERRLARPVEARDHDAREDTAGAHAGVSDDLIPHEKLFRRAKHQSTRSARKKGENARRRDRPAQ